MFQRTLDEKSVWALINVSMGTKRCVNHLRATIIIMPNDHDKTNRSDNLIC